MPSALRPRQVAMSVFVSAYIDRLLERKSRGGDTDNTDGAKKASYRDEEDEGEAEEAKRPRGNSDSSSSSSNSDESGMSNRAGMDTLNFEEFVHVLWVFSALATRSEKEEVLKTLLEPDEDGWVDERALFQFVKCMLPSVPERALEGVVDAFTESLGAEVQGTQEQREHAPREKGSGDDRKVSIQKFLHRGDFIERFTLPVV